LVFAAAKRVGGIAIVVLRLSKKSRGGKFRIRKRNNRKVTGGGGGGALTRVIRSGESSETDLIVSKLQR